MRLGPFGPWRALIVVCVLVSALSVVMGPVLFVRGDNNADRLEEIAQSNRALGVKINDSLCDVRANVEQAANDAQKEFDRSKDLIARNPGILDQFGITKQEYEQTQADDQQQIANQRRTVAALSDLSC